MIYKQSILTINGNNAKLDEDIYLFRLDKNIELYFTIVNNKYKFNKSDLNNIINLTNASYFQMRLYKNAEVKYTFAIQPTDNGKAILTITDDLIDEPIEVGDYDFQISLLDADKSSMISLPIVSKQIHVCEPLVTDASETGTAVLGLSTLESGEIVDAFDEEGNYIRKVHVNGELISAELFNKWEEALETNSSNIKTLDSQFKDIAKQTITTEERTKLTNLENYDDSEIKNDIQTQKARIDSLTSLKEGSTTGDAELIDARIDSSGRKHTNVGDNIRNISQKLSTICGGDIIYFSEEGYNKKPLLNTGFSANNVTQTILSNNGRNIVWNKADKYMGLSDLEIKNDSITLSQTDRILFVSKIRVNKNDFNTLDFRLNLSGLSNQCVFKTIFNTVNGENYYIAGIVNIDSDYSTPTARGVSVTIAGLNDNSKNIDIDVNCVYVFIIKDKDISIDLSNSEKIYNYIDTENNKINITNTEGGEIQKIKNEIQKIKNDFSTSLPVSKWKNKNVLVLGDSISSDYYLKYKSWATQLSELKEFNLVNKSVHANGFISSPDSLISGSDSMINKIDTVHTQYPNSNAFDLIIMFMGTNDFGNGVPLGKFGDGNKEKNQITTFHGGVEYCMRKALEYWCSARIIVLTPLQRRTQIYATSEGKSLKDYKDVIIEKANYMGYPILDLYSISGFYPVKKAFNAIMTTDGTESTNNAFCNMYCMKPDNINPDGLHPNELFTTTRLVPLIGDFIERI